MSFKEDDDFADFQNCTFEQDEQNKAESNRLTTSIDQDEDFADFQNADLVVNRIDQSVSDPNLVVTNNFTPCSSSTTTDNRKFESILNHAFPCSNNESKKTDERMVTERELFTDQYKRSLWNQIQNLEESPSLKLKWDKTHSFQDFLSALRINPKNKLNNPHVPIFASSLGLLEPVKLHINADNKSEEHISSNHPNGNTITTEHSVSIDKPSYTSQLENDLLDSLNTTNLMCKNFDSSGRTTNDKLDQTVNDLMKPNLAYEKLFENIKKVENRKKNDEDANNKILNELPILDFMKSNSLMFRNS